MIKNYLNIAFRKMCRKKGTAIINITCLTIGVAVCISLLLWVQDEVSFDQYHNHSHLIYRVLFQVEVKGEVIIVPNTPIPLSSALVREFPWITKSIALVQKKQTIKCNGNIFKESVVRADEGIFDIFTIPLLVGDYQSFKNSPDSIFISESMKTKFYGSENPIGKIISFPNSELDYKIAGVFKDIPLNSHFRFDFLCNLNRQEKNNENWGMQNYYTYIVVREDAPLDTFRQRMPDFVAKYRGKNLRDQFKMTFLLQPLSDIHRTSLKIENDKAVTIAPQTIYFVSLIAFFILFIACLNYIHLATATFSVRSKEAAIRRVLGAEPRRLIVQFLVESYLYAFCALVLGLIFAVLLLPVLNSLADKSLTLSVFTYWPILLGVIGITLFVGAFSGIVPAFFMIKYNLVSSLKGVNKNNPLIVWLRKFLVVFQFTMAIIFLCSVLIISHQLIYMESKDLGLNKENVLNIAINKNEEAIQKYQIIKQEILKNPNVLAVSASAFTPGRPTWNNNYYSEGMAQNAPSSIGCLPIDYDFLNTFKISILAGRGFSEKFSTDAQNAFLINKAAEKALGFNSAIGKNLDISKGWKTGTIIGVVDNFHYNSLHGEVEPLVLYIEPPDFDYFSVRVRPGSIPTTLKYLENLWHRMVPGTDFVYTFIDEDYQQLYNDETRIQKIFIIIAILEILLSCLGLLGLIAFSAEKRTREMAIRKILGASLAQLNKLLFKDFLLWIFISNLLAWPVVWYAMKIWLQQFAYRIDLSFWHFGLTGIAVFIIATLTVGYKTIKAASANPVQVLKYE